MIPPCPSCGGRAKIRATYREKGSRDSLDVRVCSNCRTEWVHAKGIDKWYKNWPETPEQETRASDEHAAAVHDSPAHRLGRLIAIFDVASEKAGLKTSYIERHVKNPKFVSCNWKLECATNAISSLESVELRERLDALIQENLGDRAAMRGEADLSKEELETLQAEYRRYKNTLMQTFDEPTYS